MADADDLYDLRRQGFGMDSSSPDQTLRAMGSVESFATAQSTSNSPDGVDWDMSTGQVASHLNFGSDASESEEFARKRSNDDLDRSTPVPSTYRSRRHVWESRLWDSEDTNPRSSSRTTTAGHLSDSNRYRSSPSLSSKYSLTRLNTPSTRRDGSSLPPMLPPPTKPLPPPTPRTLGRVRSASLLGMASTVAAEISANTPSQHRLPSPSPTTAHRQPSPVNDASSLRTSNTTPTAEPPSNAPYTLLVVGSPGCGKSTLISKGLRPWNVTRQATLTLAKYTVPVPANSVNGTPSHTVAREITGGVWHATTSVKTQTTNQLIVVWEVSSPQLIACGSSWPTVIDNSLGAHNGRGGVDAVMFCYDPTDAESWDIAKVLLRDASKGYKSSPIQAIILACKVDLFRDPVPKDYHSFHPILTDHCSEADKFRIGMREEESSTSTANSDSRLTASAETSTISTSSTIKDLMPDSKQLNLGLVPVSIMDGPGKKKMRDAFNWVFRRIDRARRQHARRLAVLQTTRLRSTTPTAYGGGTIDPMTSVQDSKQQNLSPISPTTTTSSSRQSFNPHSKSSTIGSITPIPTSPVTNATTGTSSQLRISVSNSNFHSSPPLQSSTTTSYLSSPPTSPNRARSTSDLASEMARGRDREREREEREKEFAGLRAVAAVAAATTTSGYTSSGTDSRRKGSVVATSSGGPINGRGRSDSVVTGYTSAASTGGGNNSGSKIPQSQGQVQGSLEGSTSVLGPGAGYASGGGAPTAEATGVGGGLSQQTPAKNIGVTVSMLPAKTPKEPPPMQYATLDELFDKLFFVVVTNEDPDFVEQFLLIFRRFATSRSLLLGMQKRIRALSALDENLLMAKFAQMRICGLLEDWMQTYPGDFAAPGALPALQALIRQIVTHPHTSHYGADMVPFLQIVPQLVDVDKSWALRSHDYAGDDDELRGALETVTRNTNPHPPDELDEGEAERQEALNVAVSVSIAVTRDADAEVVDREELDDPAGDTSTQRNRRSSMIIGGGSGSANLGPKPSSVGNSGPASSSTPGPSSRSTHSGNSGFLDSSTSSSTTAKQLKGPNAPPGSKPVLKELLKASTALSEMDPQHVAEEITRIEIPLFLAVEPRDWLRHGLGKKPVAPGTPYQEEDSIRKMAKFYNYVSLWTTSLILAHDKPRNRAKAMEKFIYIAKALRQLNNYSGLRAVVSGINNSRVGDKDPASEILSTRGSWKVFKSLEVLLGTTRMHSAYRMALKHTVGVAIPSMEVHTYDLIRADDTNPNFKHDDPSKIHWGKFALMAKMILNVVSYQRRFEDAAHFTFPERSHVNDVLMNVVVMDEEMIYSRSAPMMEGHMIQTGSDHSTTRLKQFLKRF
ncbi:hypothetical protein FRC03_000446 [Tulasnella sp. 419]|nr:hypothetical protein FRC03_000446 [Tulasnella sp. 419]